MASKHQPQDSDTKETKMITKPTTSTPQTNNQTSPSPEPHPQNRNTKQPNQPYLPSIAAHTQPTHNPPPGNPQHIKLRTQNTQLESRLATTKAELHRVLSELRPLMPSTPVTSDPVDKNSPDEQVQAQAKALVRAHISLLHRYNETKDVGLGLMGVLADRDGRRLGEVMELFGVDEGD